VILLLPALLHAQENTADPEAIVAEQANEGETAADLAPAPVEPGFISEVLPSGMKVSILSDPDQPIVATQMWVQVGSAHEANRELGFAHLFEHLMFGETATHDKEAYSRHHTIHGGSENAYTSFDNTVYISEIGPSEHEQVLAFEADRMVNLILDAENLANEQKIVTEELRMRTENNPAARLMGPALATLFGAHPYGHSPAGTKEDIAGADLELVQKFYAGYYHPANMHLVIAGPVNGPQTLATIESLFAAVDKERITPPEVADLSGWTFPEQVTLKEDLPPVKIAAQVWFGPTRRDADYWAYRVMTEMLAGGELDRFREELVTKRGKAIEAFTLAEELRAGAILSFASMSLPFRSRGKAFRLLDQTVEALSEGDWMSEESLETVRRRMLRDELGRSYYAASMADAIGQAYAWQGDDRLALEGASEAIDAVTLDQVRAAWQAHVLDAEPVELFIKKGKATELAPETTALHPGEER
jgi:zinc protease